MASEVAGVDLSAWFHRALETTEELDYAEALAWYGLRFAGRRDKDKDKDKDKKPPKAWLGLDTKPEAGRLMVTVVKRGTPGYEAGFNVGDEILAIGEDRVLPEHWSRRMEQYRPNERVSVLVARRGRLLRLDATFGRRAGPAMEARARPGGHRRAEGPPQGLAGRISRAHDSGQPRRPGG